MHAFYYLAIFIKIDYLIWRNFFIKIGTNTYLLALGMGPFMRPGYIGRKILAGLRQMMLTQIKIHFVQILGYLQQSFGCPNFSDFCDNPEFQAFGCFLF